MRPIVGAMLVFTACLTFAQPATGPTAFEVASIRPGNPDSRLLRALITPGGNLRAENVTLRTLIEDAYQMKPFQLIGGPRWIDDDKFAVLAKGEASATADQVRLMLQGLLGDRFRLVLRRETKEQTITYLSVKNKPKLRPSEEGTRRQFTTSGQRDGVNHVSFKATPMGVGRHARQAARAHGRGSDRPQRRVRF